MSNVVNPCPCPLGHLDDQFQLMVLKSLVLVLILILVLVLGFACHAFFK